MSSLMWCTAIVVAYLVGYGYGFRKGETKAVRAIRKALLKSVGAMQTSAITMRKQMARIHELEECPEGLKNRAIAARIIN